MRMPYCKECGNSSYFVSSRVDPAAPEANGPISGLVGKFDADGDLVEMESLGASDFARNDAAVNPVVYFDTCMQCGSMKVSW
jgi:hypothetical protein